MKSEISLLKKFSIGISFGQINPNEFCIILKKYSEYIHDVYFSPTENIRFLTRHHIYDLSNTSNDERFINLNKILSVAKELDIKISLTLNSPMLKVEEALAAYIKYAKLFPLDYVTTTSKLAYAIREIDHNIKLICSYNEAITSYNKLENIVSCSLFGGVVLGNKFIRDRYAFNIINNAHLESILLVNNGCTWGCTNFCKANVTDYCKNKFNQELAKSNYNELYAIQSIFPEELIEYEKRKFDIKVYKLSSRPISFVELDNLLTSYISKDSRAYISKNVSNYHLYARLGHFGKYYPELNYERIIDYKRSYWENNVSY